MLRLGSSLVIAIGFLAAIPLSARADIYKCLDARGRPLYTSDKRDTEGRKCETVSREVNVVSAPAAPASKPAPKASPAGFPRESAAERQSSRAKQRDTIEKELNQEQSMLADARKKLSDQEAMRGGDEKNYARVLERLRPYQDTVEVHEKNVEALKRELGNLSR